MNNILNRIKSEINEFKEKDLIDLHDEFMARYGYISIEEFKEIPIPTLLNLYNKICKEKQINRTFMSAVLKLLGAKESQIGWLK